MRAHDERRDELMSRSRRAPGVRCERCEFYEPSALPRPAELLAVGTCFKHGALVYAEDNWCFQFQATEAIKAANKEPSNESA